MKKALILIMALIMLIGVVGCSPNIEEVERELEGVWMVEDENCIYTYLFENGNVSYAVQIPLGTKIPYNGTYEIKNKEIVIDVDTAMGHETNKIDYRYDSDTFELKLYQNGNELIKF